MGRISLSHDNSTRFHTKRPQDIHKQPDLPQKKNSTYLKQLAKPSTARSQSRHVTSSPIQNSDTSTKMKAIFCIMLIASAELLPPVQVTSLRNSREGKRSPKTLIPKKGSNWAVMGRTIEYSVAPFLGAVALGPLGVLLSMPRPTRSTELSPTDVPSPSFYKSTKPQHGVLGSSHEGKLLHGKIDLLAEQFEKGAIAYKDFHGKHPELAEAALNTVMICADGLKCAVAAAIPGAALGAALGAPFGQVITGAAIGALHMAGRGFVTCAQKSIVQAAIGKTIHSMAGAELEVFMTGAIDIMAPRLEKLDHRLVETGRGRIAAAGFLFTTLSIADVAPETWIRSAYKGPLTGRVMADAFVRGSLLTSAEAAKLTLTITEEALPGVIQDIAFDRALAFGSQAMSAPPGQTEFSYDPNHELGAPGNFFEQPEMREAFFQQLRTDSDTAFAQIAEKTMQPVMIAMQKAVHVNRQLLDLEKNPDKKTATREAQKIIKAAEADQTYRQTITQVENLGSIASSVASISGSPKWVERITLSIQGGIKVIEGMRQFATISSTTMSMPAMASALPGPVGLVMAGASMIFSLIRQHKEGEEEDPHSIISKQIFQVSEQVQDLTTLTVKGTNLILERCDEHREQMNHGFNLVLDLKRKSLKYLDRRISDTQVSILYPLDQVSRMGALLLNVFLTKMDALILDPFIRACTAYGLCRPEALQTMPRAELRPILENLIYAILGDSPRCYCVNGCSWTDFTPEGINRLFASGVFTEDILGFLANYQQSILNIPLQQGLHAEDLANMRVLNSGLERYIPLRRATIQRRFSWDDIKIYNQTREEKDRIVSYSQDTQKNKVLFEKLLGLHNKSLSERLPAVEQQAFDLEAQELSDKAYEDALAAAQQKIRDFENNYLKKYDNFKGLLDWPRELHLKTIKSRKDYMLSVLENNFRDRERFRVFLDNTGRIKISKNHHKFLSPFVYPHFFQSDEDFYSFTFDLSVLVPKIEKYIPPYSLDLEGLGQGRICVTYDTAATAGHGVFAIRMFFQIDKGYDAGKKVFIGIVILKNPKSPGNPTCPSFPMDDNIWKTYRPTISDENAGPQLAISDRWMSTQIWEDAQVVSWHPMPKAEEKIAFIYKKATLGIFQHVISSTLHNKGTKLGVEYHQILEEVSANRHLINAYGVVGGFVEQKLQELSSLPSGESIIQEQQDYFSTSMVATVEKFLAEGGNRRVWGGSSAKIISENFLAQFDQPGVHDINYFTARLEYLIDKFFDLTQSLQTTKLEEPDRVQEVPSEDDKVAEIVPSDKEFSQKMAGLELQMKALLKENEFFHRLILERLGNPEFDSRFYGTHRVVIEEIKEEAGEDSP